jgi:hypothetical protein
MLLTGRGLGVQLRNHRLYLAELARELGGTLAGVLVDPVHAGAAVLAHVVETVVHVAGAVWAAAQDNVVRTVKAYIYT